MQLGHPPTPHRPGNFGWRETLIALHEVVRASVLASSREAAGRRNAKGDSVTTFDLAADRAAIESLAQGPLPLIIDSEESGRQHIGQGSARYRLVLDPVDGSDNWACGLPLSAVSCAILAPDAPLHPDAVEWALVGPLEQEVPCLAERTGGAWCGAARLATSGIGSLADAMISVELNHFAPPRHVTRLMAAARGGAQLRFGLTGPAARRDRSGRCTHRPARSTDRGELPRRSASPDRGRRIGDSARRRPATRTTRPLGRDLPHCCSEPTTVSGNRRVLAR